MLIIFLYLQSNFYSIGYLRGVFHSRHLHKSQIVLLLDQNYSSTIPSSFDEVCRRMFKLFKIKVNWCKKKIKYMASWCPSSPWKTLNPLNWMYSVTRIMVLLEETTLIGLGTRTALAVWSASKDFSSPRSRSFPWNSLQKIWKQ